LRDAVLIRYQELERLPDAGRTAASIMPVWKLQAVAADAIVRRSRPHSLAQVTLVDASNVAGYPLLWVRSSAAAHDKDAAIAASDATALADTPADSSDGQTSAPRQDGDRRAVLLDSIKQQWQQLKSAPQSHWSMVLQLQDESTMKIAATDIERLLLPNRLTLMQAAQQALINAWLFLTHGPDDGVPGILPAILGTVLLVLVMSVLLVPVAILTAVYLHEYAPQNWITGLMRAAISNLAGVPGVVYGVFVLGVFVYGAGGRIDALLFAEQLPLPTFGTGGLLWAALALALLTMPVVIAATEEGLSRIPADLRLASLALGATRTEMIWGVVVMAARPALLTGLILAIARAAGEVAPLLLLGAVAYTQQPLLDGQAPFLHVEQPFMHLGYQVYDFAMQSGQSDDAIAMAYAATLVLVLLVVVLNLFAFRLRASLRSRFSTAQS
jgi:phosphate transport system permease protein